MCNSFQVKDESCLVLYCIQSLNSPSSHFDTISHDMCSCLCWDRLELSISQRQTKDPV